MALSAPGTEQPILRSPLPKIANDWSRDGRTLVFWVIDPKTSQDIWVAGPDGQDARPFVNSDADERDARLSPDGRWIAYQSNETGSHEVYVRPFPKGGGKWQVSAGGGSQPQWQPDGRVLYYLTPDNHLVSAQVRQGPSGLAFGPPSVLMPLRVAGWEPGRGQYAVSTDGSRVLVSTKTDETVSITMMTHWAAAPAR